jgi:hypothetical protein
MLLHAHTQSGRIVNQMTEAAQRKKNMANQVKTPMQNYFEKVLYENLTFEIPTLWFFRVVEG